MALASSFLFHTSPSGCGGGGPSSISGEAGVTGEFSGDGSADVSGSDLSITGVGASSSAYAGLPICLPDDRYGLTAKMIRYASGEEMDVFVVPPEKFESVLTLWQTSPAQAPVETPAVSVEMFLTRHRIPVPAGEYLVTLEARSKEGCRVRSDPFVLHVDPAEGPSVQTVPRRVEPGEVVLNCTSAHEEYTSTWRSKFRDCRTPEVTYMLSHGNLDSTSFRREDGTGETCIEWVIHYEDFSTSWTQRFSGCVPLGSVLQCGRTRNFSERISIRTPQFCASGPDMGEQDFETTLEWATDYGGPCPGVSPVSSRGTALARSAAGSGGSVLVARVGSGAVGLGLIGVLHSLSVAEPSGLRLAGVLPSRILPVGCALTSGESITTSSVLECRNTRIAEWELPPVAGFLDFGSLSPGREEMDLDGPTVERFVSDAHTVLEVVLRQADPALASPREMGAPRRIDLDCPPPPNQCKNNAPDFKQNDPNWNTNDNSDNLPGGKSMSAGGCAVTALTNAVRACDSTLTITPLDMLKWLKDNQGLGSTGGLEEKGPKVACNYGGKTRCDARRRPSFNADEKKRELCAGHVPVVKVHNPRTNNTHFVTLTGVSGDSFSLSDPGSSDRTDLGSFPTRYSEIEITCK